MIDEIKLQKVADGTLGLLVWIMARDRPQALLECAQKFERTYEVPVGFIGTPPTWPTLEIELAPGRTVQTVANKGLDWYCWISASPPTTKTDWRHFPVEMIKI